MHTHRDPRCLSQNLTQPLACLTEPDHKWGHPVIYLELNQAAAKGGVAVRILSQEFEGQQTIEQRHRLWKAPLAALRDNCKDRS